MVEKPFTRTTEEADQLISLAKEKGLILTVFQNRRWVGFNLQRIHSTAFPYMALSTAFPVYDTFTQSTPRPISNRQHCS